jgi:hypothetical protein
VPRQRRLIVERNRMPSGSAEIHPSKPAFFVNQRETIVPKWTASARRKRVMHTRRLRTAKRVAAVRRGRKRMINIAVIAFPPPDPVPPPPSR